MDPKNINNLDPKLKETYERVMGTSFPTPQPVSPQPINQPTPQTNPEPVPTPQQTMPQQIESQTPPQPVLQQVSEPSNPLETSQIFRAGDPFTQPDSPPAELIAKANMGSDGVTQPQQQQKKKHNFIPVLLILGGIVFFAAYAAVWAKVFNLF